jgi:hypothetical protein
MLVWKGCEHYRREMKFALSGLVVAAVLVSLTVSARAASVTATNIFNTGSFQATATSSSEYNGGDGPQNAVDLNGYNQLFFNDGQAGNETLSLTNFSDPSGIDTLRFYDTEEYEAGRLAGSVTIYTSTSVETSTSSADYTLLGNFALPTMSNSAVTNGHSYTTASYAGTNGVYDYYDDLTGLGIGSNVKSILLDFGPTPGIGYGFSEIQGFAATPEPSTYALIGLGLLALLAIGKFRKLAV